MVMLLVVSVTPADARKAKGPDDAVIRSGGVPIRQGVMSSQEQQQLADQQASIAGAGCPGAFPLPIAVSVFGRSHFTAGQDVLLSYAAPGSGNPVNPVTNEGGAWQNPNFIAPCSGLYFFSIEFVKDSYYSYGTPPQFGTQDDVSVYLMRNGAYVGEAWSGEGAGKRGTGAYTVILRLNMLDSIQTWVHSDGGPMRHLSYYNFTGHRIGN
jgi:hypothetical protein